MTDKKIIAAELQHIQTYFEAKADMSIGNGKMKLLSWANAVRDAQELLKEQEPAQVIQREAMHMLFWCCGSCGVAITEGDKFCRMCGKAVRWDD